MTVRFPCLLCLSVNSTLLLYRRMTSYSSITIPFGGEQMTMKRLWLLGLSTLLTCSAIDASYVANSCLGSCGTDASNGSVPNPPSGSSYVWVSTTAGLTGGGTIPAGSPGGETDGSTLTSAVFTAAAGDPLKFDFLYITSDGTSTFPDYAWAALLNATDGSEAALLFTAETVPSPGSIVPGFNLPPTTAS